MAAISHTIPLTVAAEQGLIGLLAYLRADRLRARADLPRGCRPGSGAGPPTIADVASAAVAAAFCALVLHTLVYAAFLEDPLAWTLLAIAAVLGAAHPAPEAPSQTGAEGNGARPRTAAAPARLR